MSSSGIRESLYNSLDRSITWDSSSGNYIKLFSVSLSKPFSITVSLAYETTNDNTCFLSIDLNSGIIGVTDEDGDPVRVPYFRFLQSAINDSDKITLLYKDVEDIGTVRTYYLKYESTNASITIKNSTVNVRKDLHFGTYDNLSTSQATESEAGTLTTIAYVIPDTYNRNAVSNGSYFVDANKDVFVTNLVAKNPSTSTIGTQARPFGNIYSEKFISAKALEDMIKFKDLDSSNNETFAFEDYDYGFDKYGLLHIPKLTKIYPMAFYWPNTDVSYTDGCVYGTFTAVTPTDTPTDEVFKTYYIKGTKSGVTYYRSVWGTTDNESYFFSSFNADTQYYVKTAVTDATFATTPEDDIFKEIKYNFKSVNVEWDIDTETGVVGQKLVFGSGSDFVDLTVDNLTVGTITKKASNTDISVSSDISVDGNVYADNIPSFQYTNGNLTIAFENNDDDDWSD